ncbi:hypothetical protein APS_0460 [Acetobacter pasteurianus subsp. pasteurianus LMG 1262 = NBRC 106471]|uniref:hypothetical protein n=1 Tax=Acetobacter pasteurianus TaxID=438 RepID=UPI000245718A|nr:hypothetical protein [Acetobacter pasteurianus]GAB29858.1 hypothetical protein APS_0460 [Acetobacter pasteurianus subsp. pasteurianus LMG 1262 = NBRC 106471]GCD50324.1 hypothetical protein NBRC106471_1880 [Acetobacter pasteurianus subsp. pasteurianus LMG 1262 = NBRC 106471]
MKFFPLYETAANSGTFQLGSVEIDADSTSAAVAIAEQNAPAGCRTAVCPYRSLSGLPESLPPTSDEIGKLYDVLAQPDGASGLFQSSGQVFGSMAADAAGMVLSLERFFGYRLGLLPQGEKAAVAPATSGGSTSATSSGATPTGSGTVVSSGGSVTPAS